MFLYFCLWLFKSLSQMAFYFSNLILQTAIHRLTEYKVDEKKGDVDEQDGRSY